MAYYRNTRTGEKWVHDGLGSARSYARMAVLFLVLFLVVAVGVAVYNVYFTDLFSCPGCGTPAGPKTKPKSKSKAHRHTQNELFEGTDDAMQQLGKLP